jgi:hypothetical protein
MPIPFRLVKLFHLFFSLNLFLKKSGVCVSIGEDAKVTITSAPTAPTRHSGFGILQGVKLEFLLFRVHNVTGLPSISECLNRGASIIQQSPVFSLLPFAFNLTFLLRLHTGW